ncbi:MAG: ice-binding family protein [archaeon]
MKSEKTSLKKILSNIFVYLTLFTLMGVSVYAYASPSAVNLGNATGFAILAKSSIDNSANPATTTITGNIGVSPAAGSTITGVLCSRVNGTIYDVDNTYSGNGGLTACLTTDSTLLGYAVGDLGAAITDANGRAADNTDLAGIAASQCVAGTCDLRGITFAPGVYKFTVPGNVIITQDIYLSGSAIDKWIFIIPGTLDISSAKIVHLSGGAVPANVFWSVAGATTLGTYSTFEGNILEAGTPIAIQTGATLNGRALSKFAVTLDAATVTIPTSSSSDPVLTTITLSPASATITTGSTLQLNATKLDQYNNSIAATINYASNDTAVANVSSSGLVTAVGSGSATINASSGNLSAISRLIILAAVVGDSSNINTALTNVSVMINGVNATNGMSVSGTQPVNITSNGLPVLDFNYNFTASPLNFSTLNISNGTRTGAHYFVVTGVNSTGALVGTKTIYMYDVNTSYNGICVQDIETASIPSVNCNGAGEFPLSCNGVSNNGITCTKSTGDTTLTISGLHHTGMIQLSVPSILTAVNLGTAGNFVILTKSGISTTGTTLINGNIGVSPAAAVYITGFGALPLDASGTYSTSALVNGSVYAADYTSPTPSMMTTAISDMGTAYTDAAGRTLPDHTELGSGNIGGMTLAPGLYKWGSGVTIPTDVTLSGNSTGVWIFQIAQTLDIASGKQVILAGGAQAKNIFWQVAGVTTLGTTSVFNGNILSGPGVAVDEAIAIRTGAVLNGRALSQKAVTLQSNNVSLPVGVVVSSDILPPIVTLNAPDNNIWTNDNLTSFNFTFVDTVSATANCSLIINGIVYNVSLTTNNVSSLITPNATLAEGGYTWYVECKDLSGNSGTSASRVININDNTTAPTLSNISSSAITSSGAIIAWTTNQGANSTVNYGTTLDLGSKVESSSLATSHSISLSLSAGTLYYYNITSCDPTGNCNTSGAYNFTTLAATPSYRRSNGGGGGEVAWTCGEWSTCNSEGIRTRTCTQSNGRVTTAENESCTPVQTTAAQTTTSKPSVVPVAPQTTNPGSTVQNTGATDQSNDVITPSPVGSQSPVDSQITGQAIAKSMYTPSWWVAALVMLGIVGLGMGGYFIFRKPSKPFVNQGNAGRKASSMS